MIGPSTSVRLCLHSLPTKFHIERTHVASKQLHATDTTSTNIGPFVWRGLTTMTWVIPPPFCCCKTHMWGCNMLLQQQPLVWMRYDRWTWYCFGPRKHVNVFHLGLQAIQGMTLVRLSDNIIVMVVVGPLATIANPKILATHPNFYLCSPSINHNLLILFFKDHVSLSVDIGHQYEYLTT